MNDDRSIFPRRPRLQMLVVALLFLLGLAVRLYDLQDPPLDFHPTRQLRAAILARGFYYAADPNADPAMVERAVDLANSLESYEPPILERLVAWTYRAAGGEYLWMGRVYSALFWLLGGLALWMLARRFSSFDGALAALAFYLFLPFAVVASRSFQPDPWMVMWLLFAAYAIYRWAETQRWRWALWSGVLAGAAVLVKMVALFPIAGMLAAVCLGTIGLRRSLRSAQTWALAGLLVAPSLLYYIFNLGARSLGFFSFWTVSLSRMVLDHTFYADWLAMAQSLTGLALPLVGLWGVLLIPTQATGDAPTGRPGRALLIGFWLGYGVYGLLFPYQMITHDYYHLMFVPLVALSLAPAAALAFERIGAQGWVWRAAAVGVLLCASGYALWVARSVLYAASYANEPIAWRQMGAEIPSDGPFIALTSDYGNRLKYYGWRAAVAYWPVQGDLDLAARRGSDALDYQNYFDEKTQGMSYFVVTAFAELEAQPQLKELLLRYPVAAEGDGYIVYDLRAGRNP